MTLIEHKYEPVRDAIKTGKPVKLFRDGTEEEIRGLHTFGGPTREEPNREREIAVISKVDGRAIPVLATDEIRLYEEAT